MGNATADEQQLRCLHETECRTLSEHVARRSAEAERAFHSPGANPPSPMNGRASTTNIHPAPGPLSPATAGAAIDLFLAKSGLNHDGQIMALAGAQLSIIRRAAASTGGGV